ncbi:hypothetical protein FXW78_47245 [Rhodococcus opacus]|nr:hypothetical protein [Rhodococcus opacus]
MVGRHFRLPDYYEVGEAEVREYARAVFDPHPAHRDEAAARRRPGARSGVPPK